MTADEEMEPARVELINRVKAAEKAFLDAQAAVVSYLQWQQETKRSAAQRVFRRHDNNSERLELDRFERAEPFWWAAKAKRDTQIAAMALIRAIEQPDG